MHSVYGSRATSSEIHEIRGSLWGLSIFNELLCISMAVNLPLCDERATIG